MTSQIEPTVVFDIGNVLVDWNPRHLFRKLIADEAAMERFLSEVCTTEWNNAQDRGRTWAEAVELLLPLHPAHADHIRAYDARWQEMIAGPIPESVGVLEDLKAEGRKVYAITNFSAEKWAESQVRFPFLTLFDGVVVSAHERLMKPEPEIYECLLERYELQAERCVFIDDSEKNVLAARALGMRAIHFGPATRLRDELRALGVRLAPSDA